MQALAERIDAFARGRVLTRVVPYAFAALKTVTPSPDELRGRALDGVSRRGKFLVFRFGDRRLLIHLSQGGRIDVEDPPKQTKPKGAVARFEFDDRAILVKEFGTERKAGWWVLDAADDGPLVALGPEPFDDAFADLIATSTDRGRIHTLLRDQRTVAGIGRGYADDALHRARLSPYATMAQLDGEARARLLDAIHAVLTEALDGERGRTGGLPAKLGDRFAVHGRAGLPCPRCRDDLRRVSYDAYEVVYCPVCQTGGKVLADRRMSRLIR